MISSMWKDGDAQQFWDSTEPEPNTGCWLWTRGIIPRGYGAVGFLFKVQRAHRVAWELVHGPIPLGMQVCHRCDVRSCCNPRHLFLGTNDDNQADMRSKGRAHPTIGSKLTAELAKKARLMHANGLSQSEIGRRLGVSSVTIHAIVHGRYWKAAGGPLATS